MLRCPTCGFPLMQIVETPYTCTNPHSTHYSVECETGLKPVPAPEKEENKEPINFKKVKK